MVLDAGTGGDGEAVPNGLDAAHEVNAAAPMIDSQLAAANAEDGEGREEGNQDQHAEEEEDEEEEEEATEENATSLFDSGCKALDSGDFEAAGDALSKALEIRVKLYGDLAPECASAYYKYGCSLLAKVQSESDALADEAPAREKGLTISERADAEEAINQDKDEDIGEDDDSDLELAWKMMDIARVIHEKRQTHSLEEVDVISGLADISLEKADFQSCLEDYNKALDILKGLVEPHDRRLAELYFKMALAKQLSKAPKEAIELCQLAVAICENRLERLKGEPSCKEEEIKEMESLLVDLKEKVDELHEMAAAPSLLEALKAENAAVADTVKETFKAIADLTGSKAPVDGAAPSSSKDNVIHLGVVGRGIKRATPVPVTENGTSAKASKTSLEA